MGAVVIQRRKPLSLIKWGGSGIVTVLVSLGILWGLLSFSNPATTRAMTAQPNGRVRYTDLTTSERISVQGDRAVLKKALNEVTLQSWQELWIASGSKMFRITGIQSPPSWATDGSYCVATNSELELVRIDLGNGSISAKSLGIKGLYPEVSRDGEIAFSDAGRMKVLCSNGQIADVSRLLGARGDCERWAWQPDGSLTFDTRMPGESVRHLTFRPRIASGPQTRRTGGLLL